MVLRERRTGCGGGRGSARLNELCGRLDDAHPALHTLRPQRNAVVFLAHKEPGAASTARARHRRVQLPCTTDLYRLADLDALMRDLRHQQASAFDELEDWIAELDVKNYAAKTLYGYGREIAPLLRAHPHKTMGEFTAADINDQLRLKPPRSRHITRSIYNGWFTWGHKRRRIVESPMFDVPEIPNPKRRPKDIFSVGEIGLLEGLPMPDGPLWTLMFKVGLRRGDCRHLQRRHVDLNRARLMIYNGKGDKDAILPLTTSALTAVADLDLFERLNPGDHFWYRHRYQAGDRRRRQDPIGDTTFERWYHEGIEAAGVRYLNPHQTRHTFNWWLRSEGLDLEERQLMMRHESSQTTERDYGRLTIDDFAHKLAAL